MSTLVLPAFFRSVVADMVDREEQWLVFSATCAFSAVPRVHPVNECPAVFTIMLVGHSPLYHTSR